MEMKLNENWKTELPNKEESARRKQKVITVEMKFELNINGVGEEITDCGDVDTTTVRETLHQNIENRK